MQKRSEYLIFGQPLIEEAEIAEVVHSMRSGWLGTGPKVKKFEELIAAYKGVKYAMAVNSATAGLHLSCIALGLKPGDEVITTPMTFCATVNAIIHAGATPVLADIEPDSFNIDPVEIKKKITPRTRALLPVHFAGRSCNMSALMSLAEEHNLKVIEDCAHAIETEYQGKKAGAFGDCGVVSFYATKNIVTGEGGMVLTNDEEVANRIKVLSLHGMSRDAWKRFADDGYKHYDVMEVGFKYNMMDIQAAIGIHQIERVDRYWVRRQEIWARYLEAFASLPVELPSPIEPGTRHAYHLFTLLIDPQKCGITRDALLCRLHERGIGTGVHYRQIASHPAYQERFGWRESDYPNAQKVGEATISLPLSAKLSDADVEYVIHAVKDIIPAR